MTSEQLLARAARIAVELDDLAADLRAEGVDPSESVFARLHLELALRELAEAVTA